MIFRQSKFDYPDRYTMIQKKIKKRRKFPIKRIGKKKKKKIPNQRLRESKKERKFPIKDRKKTEEICRKVFGPDNIWTIDNCHQVNQQEKKGNHDLKWSSPFDFQPKSCASVNFLPRTKKKQKRKRPKYSKPNFPQKKKHHSRKSPIDPWSRM